MDKDILEKYESMRKEIDFIKEKVGFKCLRCGSCCYSSQPVCELDFEYMKEKGVDTRGIEVIGSGLLKSRKIKANDNGCFYYKDNSCTIHPYNSMLCYTYPFVVNISDRKFFFKFCPGEDKDRNIIRLD